MVVGKTSAQGARTRCLFVLLAQGAVVGLSQLDYIPSVQRAFPYFFWGCHGLLVLWAVLSFRRFRSWCNIVVFGWLLLTIAAFAYFRTLSGWFAPELIRVDRWPELGSAEAYYYLDTFRRKFVSVELRRGWFPVMSEVAFCDSYGFSAARAGNDLVLQCSGAEKRIPIAGGR